MPDQYLCLPGGLEPHGRTHANDVIYGPCGVTSTFGELETKVSQADGQLWPHDQPLVNTLDPKAQVNLSSWQFSVSMSRIVARS